jgi:hypothetical protein
MIASRMFGAKDLEKMDIILDDNGEESDVMSMTDLQGRY